MFGFIQQFGNNLPSSSPWKDEEPVRNELFSVDRFDEHAWSLAAAQPVTSRRIKGNLLADRLADNAAALLSAYQTVAKAVDDGHAITPAAVWLLDNYHLIERQVREIRSDLPPGYYKQLPKLAEGPFAGYPRVLGVVWAFVAHTDSRFDPKMLCRYVRAYQEVQPLTIGELWAVAITLRIVLIENLRRIAQRIVISREARREADDFADRLLATAEPNGESVASVLADFEFKTLTDAFAVQLVHRLRDQDVKMTLALDWLDKRLAAQDTTIDTVVHDEHLRQGTATVTVRNIITSMRLISDVDWTELFEGMSPVDDVLAQCPSYREMDFATRNLYRSNIEYLARGSKRTELEVARHAVETAKSAAATATDDDQRKTDPGYYLIARGRPEFEKQIGFKPSFRARVRTANRKLGVFGYVSMIALVEAVLLAAPIIALADWGMDARLLALLGVLGAIPAIDAAVALVNWAVTRSIGPTLLPGLELTDGIPASLRTVVAVPTLLFTPEAVAEQIEQLEIHYLASPQGDLHYVLLSDWRDADTETLDSDDAVLTAAVAGIAQLNERYGAAPGGDRFLLLHRRRVWTESEGRWIGWERKRGKLHEMNQLLRGAADTTFITAANHKIPTDVRYVITLDADTKLPHGTVRRLIGKMAHHLNRPRFDSVSGRVTEGHAILQPRVTPALPVGHESSLFQRIFSSMSGIDPYASAVSDVYQDLFGEGSYTGKGIYHIDAFEAALSGRVPDSTMLSHDLFEGVFARAGLASDVEVVEEFPARYDVSALRHHRWARGDWQLLPWILDLPSVTKRKVGPMPEVGRWKMIDNLRRTLSAPVAVVALITGWTLPFHAALIWTGFIVATIVLPTIVSIISAFAPRRPGISIVSHVRVLAGDIRLSLTLLALIVTFMAHQAWLMGDAIIRTLGRLMFSRRHLLEWVPAAQTAIAPQPDMIGFYQRMAGSVVISIVAVGAAALLENGTWELATPFAVLWLAAPAVALFASRTAPDSGAPPVSDVDAHALRLIARKTWRYFETFVTPEENMLPPDNFQEDPLPVVAHRTSPTNMGLYLLSLASARDFGWLGTRDAVTRMEQTFETLDKLSKFRGHFFNWYDTRDLRALEPQYISSVDSGNLAGHLLALANTLSAWRNRNPSDATRLTGIADALELTQQESLRLPGGRRTQTVTSRQFDDALGALTISVRNTKMEDVRSQNRFQDIAAQADIMADIAHAQAAERDDETADDMVFWADAAKEAAESHHRDVSQSLDAQDDLNARLTTLENKARAMAMGMDFQFLFDKDRKLLSIGFVPATGALDSSCYDLLASEARLASFFAIAKGDIPARHWFLLGRSVTPVAHGAALISWSGSMFEYLMPSLVMRAPTGSLIERSNKLTVRRQMEYAARLGVPWGISESAYNVRDRDLTYQYMNFGVPGLGLKRGLQDNTVVAPYATALAAMVDPESAARNFERLTSIGANGRYGFYEALDYTPVRLPENKGVAIVRAFMAHHQGMSIVSMANALLNGEMRARFHAEPIIQATELLLQERTPRDVTVFRPWASETASAIKIREVEPPAGRSFTSAQTATPATHLLSNGRYAVMLTASGSGYSRWGDIAVTRWRDDTTCDDWGSYIFLRDVDSGEVWSTGFQPAGITPDTYDVAFDEDHAEFARHDGSLSTTLEVIVSTEYDAEVRRVSLVNSSNRTREIDITSYTELVLAQQSSDMAHQAFSKLFVETAYLAGAGGLMATRRRRGPSEPEVWAVHLAVVEGETVGKPEYETDRARFLGRNCDIHHPIAIADGRPLSNTAGTVLDPIFALRRRVRIPAGGIVRIAFWTAVASTREELIDFVGKRHDTPAFERTATLAWTQAQVQLHHVGINPGEAGLFQRLARHLIYSTGTFRPSSDTIRRGAGPQHGLWGQGISGDLPIVLLRIADVEHLDIARQILQAHEYWRMKQLSVDLVIVNERASSYVQDLQIALESMARASQIRTPAVEYGPPGRVFVLRSDLLAGETRALLASVARVVLSGQGGRLSEQLDRALDRKSVFRLAKPRAPKTTDAVAVPTPPNLEFFNGLGGFADNGREYAIVLGPGQSTPAPWLNVIANPMFGFQVTAEGGGMTWAVNSRENQITPWSNDPVTDRPGEAFYLRDTETGALWSPTAQPIRDPAATYVVHHGRGYSRFNHIAHGIATELTQFVPLEDPIKISRLKIQNLSDTTRQISVIGYVEWVLGRSRTGSTPYVMTEIDAQSGAMFARNPWTQAFGARVAFADFGGQQTDWTGDRREFIGRNGTLANPLALEEGGALSNAVGAGLDPCAALRTVVDLAPGASTELIFFLGEADDADKARTLVIQYRAVNIDEALNGVGRYWDSVLGTIEVKTPDRSMDIMLNGWLLYQTLVCRVWARSGFYQSSGAYGFRDQLQDGTALASVKPELTRAHLLRAASRQFVEGDVQHWWLPHSGQGVRTRISDDRPWLAYTVAHYVEVSGDAAVLDEKVSFLEGPQLAPGEHDQFYLPSQADETASLFEHCARALDQSLAVGAHGLPLMGTGDWNDGMNRVGEHGTGESVWLGWLVFTALKAFAPLAEARGETTRAATWLAHADALQKAMEAEAWDGNWYRRGYFDDGTPFGSAGSEECKIDSIAQSWAVISGAGEPARAAHAMAAVERELIRPKDGLALLFAPPFNKTHLDPGYIKGYPPGIRENGGQYTHASLWSVIAFAMLGEGDKANDLFAMLNPINHARTRADAFRYKVEPYVVAADIYAKAPHTGRGGWTWYTGSAGWMQRAGMENILGLRMQADTMLLDPCIPKTWPRYEMALRHKSARYEIVVENPNGVSRGIIDASLDGQPITDRPLRIALQDDGQTHQIKVTLG